MKVDGTDDKYLIVPKPCNELKSAEDEMNVDGTDDRYPIVPNAFNDEYRALDEI